MGGLDERDQRGVAALGRRVVESKAPGELPVFGVMSREFFERGIRLDRSGRDVLLGIGVETAVVLLSPVALEVCHRLWESLCAEAAGATVRAGRERAGELLRRLRARFGGDSADDGDDGEPEVAFTPEQLRQVRECALRHAGALGLPEERQRLLAEAIVGVLAVTETPDNEA